MTHVKHVTRTTRAALGLGPCFSVFISFCSFCLTFASLAGADESKRACVAASTEGQTLRKQDKLLEARDKFHICAEDPCPQIVKSRCTRWLSETEAEIPSVIVRAKDSAGKDALDIEVTIDGRPSQGGHQETLDPGEHVVVVKRVGGQGKEERFLLVDGERARVLTVQLVDPEAHAPAPLLATSSPGASSPPDKASGGIPAGGWILGAVGLAALGSAAYFYVQAGSDFSGLQHSCSPGCNDSETQPFRTHLLIAQISLGVGIAAAAGAVTWTLLSLPARHARGARAPVLGVRPIVGGVMTTIGLSF